MVFVVECTNANCLTCPEAADTCTACKDGFGEVTDCTGEWTRSDTAACEIAYHTKGNAK